ncbi:unnamed protein product [Pleuronectes platessa]|uniref:Uncharacterized protein n=1 Tax=Pleuronectes platessa TaxID=8262 RepID=A0A9N7VL78_PLEPL|nr:unnamed protein product [Pleuronectes platessa]
MTQPDALLSSSSARCSALLTSHRQGGFSSQESAEEMGLDVSVAHRRPLSGENVTQFLFNLEALCDLVKTAAAILLLHSSPARTAAAAPRAPNTLPGALEARRPHVPTSLLHPPSSSSSCSSSSLWLRAPSGLVLPFYAIPGVGVIKMGDGSGCDETKRG